MAEPIPPRFLRFSEAEAAKHANYLLVTTVPWPSAKGSFHTTIEWHVRSEQGVGAAAAAVRVRMLAEREPLNAAQAREKAEALAKRNGVPVVLTVVR